MIRFEKVIQAPKTADMVFTEAMGPTTMEWIGQAIESNPERFEPPYAWGIWQGNVGADGFLYFKLSALANLLKQQGISTKMFLRWASRQGYVKTEVGRCTINKRFPRDAVHRCACFYLLRTE